jgi:hypothetical protein
MEAHHLFAWCALSIAFQRAPQPFRACTGFAAATPDLVHVATRGGLLDELLGGLDPVIRREYFVLRLKVRSRLSRIVSSPIAIELTTGGLDKLKQVVDLSLCNRPRCRVHSREDCEAQGKNQYISEGT